MPNVVISDPVDEATSLLRPGFYCPTLVVLTGFFYTAISKPRFSLHLGQTAFRWCIRDEPAGRPRNSLGLACGPKHIGNSPHMIQNNANCEKLNCFETIKRRHSKNFIFRFVFYYSFDCKDGIQSGRRWHHSSFYSGGIKSWVYIWPARFCS